MSGEFKHMRLEAVDDFLSLRKEAFGFELAPLPQSLQLPAAEIALTPRLRVRQPETTRTAL